MGIPGPLRDPHSALSVASAGNGARGAFVAAPTRTVPGAAVRSATGRDGFRELSKLHLGFVGLGQLMGQCFNAFRDGSQKIEIERAAIKQLLDIHECR